MAPSTNNNNNNQRYNIADESIELAESWCNRQVEISGVGGYIQVHKETGAVCTHFGPKQNHYDRFIIRTNNNDIPGSVAFEVVDKPGWYLTAHMYGDACRQDAAQALAAVPDVLADTIPLLVDYAIGRPTGETNFEGAGFNYSPMTATAGSLPGQNKNNHRRPTKLQLFSLVPPTPRRNHSSFGVKSLFGSYWRSQHWDHLVSQSSHLLGDETWYFRPANQNHDGSFLAATVRSMARTNTKRTSTSRNATAQGE